MKTYEKVCCGLCIRLGTVSRFVRSFIVRNVSIYIFVMYTSGCVAY